MDYTDTQTAPIREAANLPEGFKAIRINEIAQWAYQAKYGGRGKFIHIIATTRPNGPWYLSANRHKVIHKYPDDIMVFANVAGNSASFAGWLFMREIEIAETVSGPFHSMETFDPNYDAENK